jgi:cobaltochelatase CobS
MEGITKDELLNFAENSNNPIVQDLAKKKMQEEFSGDIVAQKMIQLSQLLGQQSVGKSNLDEEEVKRIVREEIETDKITFDDLDDTVKKLLSNQTATVTMNINQGGVVRVVKLDLAPETKRPLIQKMLSDVLARNNVYLYGGAGTGKTYSAGILKDLLGWDLLELSCSQFTSALQILGGQTIDGYQEGIVVRAFGNLDIDGNPTGRGCILLLDELPKIDPNTAGMLNSVLARVGEYKNVDGVRKPSSIKNSRGDTIERGDCFIMATGNALLNTKDPDYEANFKQDLSLQDRFVGSTYKVEVDIEGEWESIMNKKWAFIFIYLNKLRNAIKEEGFLSKAFVSIRLMLSVQKTYNVYRQVKENAGNVRAYTPDDEVSFTPVINERALGVIEASQVKTVKDSLDEFFSLFTTEQSDILKSKTNYDGWLRIVAEKNKMPMDKLNTDAELEEIKEILKNK